MLYIQCGDNRNLGLQTGYYLQIQKIGAIGQTESVCHRL